MAGNDDGFIGQSEQRVVERLQDFLHGTAGQVGAADRSGEECVPGYEFLFSWKIEADATFSVTGSVQDRGHVRSSSYGFPVAEAVIDLNLSG